MNGRRRSRGFGRCGGWGKGRGFGRGRGKGFGRGWGFGRFGSLGLLSKPISAIKGLFTRESPEVMRIYKLLPKRDCGACSYDNCYQCALAIAKGEAPPDACKVVGKKVKGLIEEILRG